MQLLAKYLIIFGIIILVSGLVLYFFGHTFSWLGRLPGDIRIGKGPFRIFFPVTTMILLSLVLTVLINLIRKFL